MWVFTEHGFFSVIAYSAEKAKWSKSLPIYEDPENWLVVRGRVESDIKDAADYMVERYPGKIAAPVVFAVPGDYPFRIIVPRPAWKWYMADAVDHLDYTNFKDRVTIKQGHDRHDTYMRVWSALLDLMPGRGWKRWEDEPARVTGPTRAATSTSRYSDSGLAWLKERAENLLQTEVRVRYGGLVFWCNAGHPVQMHEIGNLLDVWKWEDHIEAGGGNTAKPKTVRPKKRPRRRSR